MEKAWINFKEVSPPINKDILLIWICDRDGCMGTTKCSVFDDGSLFVSPGNFFVDGTNGEEAMYWMLIPDYPEDIQSFIEHHYGFPDEDPNSHFDNEHLENEEEHISHPLCPHCNHYHHEDDPHFLGIDDDLPF